jgi:hypothetical protein
MSNSISCPLDELEEEKQQQRRPFEAYHKVVIKHAKFREVTIRMDVIFQI